MASLSFKLQRSEVSHAWWVDVTHVLPTVPTNSKLAISVKDRYLKKYSLRFGKPFDWFCDVLLLLLGTSNIVFPCKYLSAPSDAGDLRGRDDWVLWGMTFSVVNKLVAVAERRRPDLRSPPFSFDNPVLSAIFAAWIFALRSFPPFKHSLALAVALSSVSYLLCLLGCVFIVVFVVNRIIQ